MPLIEVWNKVDALSPEIRAALAVQDARRGDIQAVSALTGEGLDALTAAIESRLGEERLDEVLNLLFAEGRARAWLHEQNVVRSERETKDGWEIAVNWSTSQRQRFRAL